jgi:hypothetical protein
MPSKPQPFDVVRAIATTIPGVEEAVSWGAQSLKVNGRLLACMAMNKSAEPGSLVVCVDMDQRDEMIAADPDTYYVTDHYVNYRAILVRLDRIHRDALRDLLTMAVRSEQARGARRRPARTRSNPGTGVSRSRSRRK